MAGGFGDRVRDAMLAAGIDTPQQLAKMCGLPARSVGKWLTLPEADLPAMALFKIAVCLRVRMYWLITGNGGAASEYLTRTLNILDKLEPEQVEAWMAIGQRMIV